MLPVRSQFLLSEAGALALKEALTDYVKDDISLKWPNDIYWKDKKLSGTLIETKLAAGRIKDCVFGVGLNVNQDVFHSDAPNPVSLCQILGHEVDKEELLNKIIKKFSELYHLLEMGGYNDISAMYHEALYRRGGFHKFRDADGEFEGAIVEVEDDGHLILRESLMGKQGFGIDPERLSDYAKQIKEVHEMGVQIGIVIGGGNIFRGLSGSQKGFDRVKGDQMGMCATVINSLALSSALEVAGVKAKVLTAIRMEPIGEFYSKWKAIEAMEAGYVCIFSAGTGCPYFTTDTGSSLRGIEIEADVMLKGTRVDGIYTADPEKDPTATKFSEITYDEIYTKGLKVMDLTATTMCKENDLPIYVFNMDVVGNLKKVMDGEDIGTLVHN